MQDKKQLEIESNQSSFYEKTLDFRYYTEESYDIERSRRNGFPEFKKQRKVEENRQIVQYKWTEQDIEDRLMDLQGECSIKKVQFLQFNCLKSFISLFLIILTFFGLFALRYSTWFRMRAFYTKSTFLEATHLFITGNGKNSAIVKIQNKGHFPIKFKYLKLKYILKSSNSEAIPDAFIFQNNYKKYFGEKHVSEGLTNQQVAKHKQQFGLNEHLVQIPNYFSYLLDVMTGPFFLLQYFFCFVYFIQSYFSFSFALLGFSFAGTTLNYIMLYISFLKIKEIAEKKICVEVIRNGIRETIDSHELVPGDIYIPKQQSEVVADCIVVKGDIYVNEANLTGQSHPIGKFQIKTPQQIQKSNVYLYEGSKILEIREGKTFALVINTGFTTTRGRIIRSILNRSIKTPDSLRSILFFLIEIVSVSLLVYLGTLFVPLSIDIEPIFILIKIVDFLASSAPPPLPIFINMVYTMSLYRLRWKNISGTEPEKTLAGAQVKTFCFDKTGTLTRPEVEITKILKINIQKKLQEKTFSKKKVSLEISEIPKPHEIPCYNFSPPPTIFDEITFQLQSPDNELIWKIFATCHTTKRINNQLQGDQIDIQMFAFSEATQEKSQDPNVRFIIKNKHNHNFLHILRVNQFESKFQSMSVLVKDPVSQKSYVFIKGAPEKLLQNSINIKKIGEENQSKFSHSSQYQNMVKILSLNGYRTIAIGYYQITSQNELQDLLVAQRQAFQKNITLMGLVAFQNKLKKDTKETMENLINSNIEPKMITGDNIYIAVETARRAGILKQDQKVVFLEGKKQKQLQAQMKIKNNLMIGLKKNKSKLLQSVKSDTDSEEKSIRNDKDIIKKENNEKIEQSDADLQIHSDRIKQNRIFTGTIININSQQQNQQQQKTQKHQRVKKKQKIEMIYNNNKVGNSSNKKIFPKQLDDPSPSQTSRMKKKLNLQKQIFNIEENIIQINQKTDFMDKYTYAIDNDFLIMFEPAMSDMIKIYARIPPMSKALIIKAYKNENKLSLIKKQSKFQRLLKSNILQVGMCGDGANDLLALKQADLSVGIQETDASYGSSFTVSNLSQVYEIIRQARCCQSNLMMIFRYYVGVPFVIVMASILMMADATYFSDSQLIYINFGTMLLIPGAMTFSRPSEKQQKDSIYVPDNNMMSLNSHLLIWGNILIPFGGIISAYYFFYNTDEFAPNPRPQVSIAAGGFYSKNHSTTLIFLFSILMCVCNGFIMYTSRPWKEPFYRNYLLLFICIGNLAVALIFPFVLDNQSLADQFEFVNISRSNMAICLTIIIGSQMVNFIFNIFVNSFRLDYKVLTTSTQTQLKSNEIDI